MMIAKFKDRLVHIVRVADTVAFSPDRGWIFVCFDFERVKHKRMDYRWIRASDARFDWVREFIGE